MTFLFIFFTEVRILFASGRKAGYKMRESHRKKQYIGNILIFKLS